MAGILRFMTFSKSSSGLINIMDTLLEKQNLVRPINIARACLSLVKLDTEFDRILKLEKDGSLTRDLNKSISSLSKIHILLKLISVSPVPDLVVERLLTQVRAGLLFTKKKIDQ